MFKRVMAWLLCLVMLFAALPMAAFATDDVAQETVAEEIIAETVAEETVEEEPAPVEEVAPEAVEEVTEAVAEETTEATEATETTEAVTEEVIEPVEIAEVETVEPSASSWRQEENDYYFSTFADLKELIALHEGDNYYYEGKEDLVIAEDITLPRDCLIFMMEEENDYHPKLVIAKGVTMVNEGNLSLDGLDVKGTLVNNWWIVARENLTVNGKLENASELIVTPECVVAGEENITNVNEYNHIAIEWVCNTGEDLVAAAKRANELSSKWCVYISLHPQEAPITLTEAITLPAHSSIVQYNQQYPIVIAQGGKLTIEKDGYVNPNGNWTIQGQIENNGRISVWHDSVFAFEVGSSYSGSGVLEAYGKETSTPYYTEVIPGLNYEEFVIQQQEQAWILRHAANIEKLAAPTDLMWGKTYDWNDDWSEMVLKDQPGSMAWGVSKPTQGQYYVCLYKEDGTLVNDGWYYTNLEDGHKWCSSNMFVADPPESGNYYFTVQAIAGDDSDEYVSSDIVKSGIYTYVRPTKKLSKPTNVKLVEPKGQEVGYAYLIASFQAKKGDYSVEWYVSKSKDTEPSLEVSYTYTAYQDGEQRDYIGKSFMNDYSGYYFYVRVRAISDDIEKAIGSDWTALSAPVKYVKKVVKKLSAPTGLKTYKDPYTGKPIIIWNPVKDAETYDLYRSTKKTSGYKKINAEPIFGSGYYDETAKVGTTYYYKVKAVNGSVKSGYSSYKSGACATAAPMISSANTASSGKVKLSWAKVENAEKYYIYRSTKKTSGFEKIGSTTKAYYTDSDASVGKTYYYRVKAVMDGITSEYSNTISGKRICAQPDLSVKIASSGKPKLSWDKVSGAKEYRITMAAYDPETGEYGDVTTATTTSTSYTHKKAVVGVTYGYVVEAIGSKSGTNSVESNVKQITCVVAAPEIKVKADPDTGKPVVSWNENEDVHWYRVYRSTKSSSGFTIIGGGFNYNEKFVDNTATAGKKYYYKVVPVDHSLRAGVASEVVSCYADCAAPVVDGSLSSKKPKLTWGKVSGAKGYEVYRSTKKSSGFKKIKTITSTSYTDKSATTGKTYYYKVKAIAPKSSANSAYSDVLKITKSTKAKQISGYWKLEGLTPSGEELDKIGLTFSKEDVFLGASYYAAVPKDKVNSVLETGVINDGEGYLYCNDLCKFDGAYYYSMGFGGGAGGTYTESGKTVVVTIEYEQTGTMTLEKIAPNQYKVKNISGIIYDEDVTEVIRSVGVFTYAP